MGLLAVKLVKVTQVSPCSACLEHLVCAGHNVVATNCVEGVEKGPCKTRNTE